MPGRPGECDSVVAFASLGALACAWRALSRGLA